MILSVNTINFVSGKKPQATDWGKRISARFKELFPNLQTSFLIPTTGNLDQILFTGQFSSLCEYEEVMKKRNEDPGFQALAQEMRDSGWVNGGTIRQFQVVEEG